MVLHSKLRSWLTIIGIIIGVAAVTAIMSLGEGMQDSLNSQLSGLGGDIVTISAGFSRGGAFFGPRGDGGAGGSSGATATTKTIEIGRSDVQVLRGVSEVKLIDTQIRGNVQIAYMGKTGSVSLTGVDQKTWAQMTTATLSQGRFLDPSDQNVVVIGGTLASTYFDKPVGINKMISINGSAFRVVGILADQSRSIYMPIQMAYQVLPTKTNSVYDSIIVKVKDESQLDSAIAKMQTSLMNARHVTATTQDFSITSSKQMQQTRAQMMQTMSIFLLALAAVSLLVGAVGIANTMFTSVLEKTKEIGIMKAIGARNSDILIIFMMNAAMIGLIGGILGIICGVGLSELAPMLLGSSPLTRTGGIVSLNTFILALSVSVGIGVISGVIPAYQASKLKPVDALRFE